jgi:hypothetical protein
MDILKGEHLHRTWLSVYGTHWFNGYVIVSSLIQIINHIQEPLFVQSHQWDIDELGMLIHINDINNPTTFATNIIYSNLFDIKYLYNKCSKRWSIRDIKL